MSAFLRRIALPLSLAAIVLPAVLAGEAKTAFTLGVLRRDGILIPFASFTGRGWIANWPDSVASVAVPISLADVPRTWWGAAGPAAPWTAWSLDAEPRPLTLRKPEQVSVFCGTHLGIATDYRGADLDPREPSVPKDGVAIAGEIKVQPVVPVSLYAPDAKQIVEAITDDFNKEEETAASHFLNWLHPFRAEERKALPIELETFYRTRDSTPSGEWSTSYIEAVRRFPARFGDNDCGLITFVRGWVLQRDGRKPVIDVGARITYCDRADVSFMQPFGKLIIDREPYWVYQVSSWRDEIYGVSRVRPEEVRPVMAVAGGGCPKRAPARSGRGRGRGGGA